MPQDIGYGYETPTNKGKVTRFEASPIAELRRVEDRPIKYDDSVYAAGWLIVILACCGVLAWLFLGFGK